MNRKRCVVGGCKAFAQTCKIAEGRCGKHAPQPYKNYVNAASRKSRGKADAPGTCHTPEGKARQMYTRMQARVRHPKHECYVGCKLKFTREEWLAWVLPREDYRRCFEQWVASGYRIKYAPSPDRLDSDKSYEFSNLEIVPQHENCRRANVFRWHGLKGFTQ